MGKNSFFCSGNYVKTFLHKEVLVFAACIVPDPIKIKRIVRVADIAG